MRYRIKWMVFFFCCIWLGLFARLVQIQVLPHPQLEKFKTRQYTSLVTLQPRRGDILDRNGAELASSLKVYSLFADPTLIKNPKKVALKISKKFKMAYQKVYKSLKKEKTHFVWIKRKLELEDKKEVLSWDIQGLGFIEEFKRVYPKGHLFSQVLGFVGSDNTGLEGIEGYYDHLLSGQSFKARILRDAKRRPLLGENSFFFERPEGNTIKLTLDHHLQHQLSKELENATKQFDADLAVGVILDAKTSEILAMGNYPFFDVNVAKDIAPALRRNKAITDAFEQGSTFKTFTITSALKSKITTAQSEYYCEKGAFMVANHTISESDKSHQFEWLTVSEILSKSSNVCSSKIAFEIGDHRLRSFFHLLGFGQKTGVDFWGENRGILPKTPWRKLRLSNIAFGQGVSATALQVANAYGAIANDGVLNKPYFLKSIINNETGREEHRKPQEVRRVISRDLAKQIQMMLMFATSRGGTGQSARVLGYPVAGKTGTAQKVNAESTGYLPGAYIASFVGFAPANDPQFIIYIAVDHPKKKSYYGSEVAAPVFANLSSFALRHYGITPTLLQSQQIFRSPQKPDVSTIDINPLQDIQLTRMPDVKGLTIKEVMQKLHGLDMDFTLIGRGQVVSTKPKGGEAMPEDKKIYLFLDQTI